MSNIDKVVECASHGEQQAAYVCQHIVETITDGEPEDFGGQKILTTLGRMHGVLSVKQKFKKQMESGIMKVKILQA